jgi:hypothetical protein
MARRTKAARTGGKLPTPLKPWNMPYWRRTVATGWQRLGFRLAGEKRAALDNARLVANGLRAPTAGIGAHC